MGTTTDLRMGGGVQANPSRSVLCLASFQLLLKCWALKSCQLCAELALAGLTLKVALSCFCFDKVPSCEQCLPSPKPGLKWGGAMGQSEGGWIQIALGGILRLVQSALDWAFRDRSCFGKRCVWRLPVMSPAGLAPGASSL